MRIVAGSLRGRVLKSPDASITRPTTDRVRESLFSSLYSRLGGFDGLHVLDAFAGSGALGIEALSRGAANCLFFERDAAARKVLEGNLSSLGLGAPAAQVRAADVLDAAGRGMVSARPFDLVLLDPPYALEPEEVAHFIVALAESECLSSGCVVSYEHALRSSAAVASCFEGDGPFKLTGQRKYGKIGVSYLEHAGA